MKGQTPAAATRGSSKSGAGGHDGDEAEDQDEDSPADVMDLLPRADIR